MSLESGKTWSNTVGVASSQQPALRRVTAGDPEASYLVHKVEGRASISGQRMPRGGPALSTDQIQRIRDWITAGAQND